MPNVGGIALLLEIRFRGNNAIFIIFIGLRLAHVTIETQDSGGKYYPLKGVVIISELPKVVDYIRSHLTTIIPGIFPNQLTIRSIVWWRTSSIPSAV